ncbi:MAG: YitT family protein [Lachnospiraceae bacterium]|nr:YitT family protein [Lachnospiraceae bacterium]
MSKSRRLQGDGLQSKRLPCKRLPGKQRIIEDIRFFLLLNCGLFFTALGIALFKTPNHFAFGGTSGISIILSTLFPKWNVGIFMWIVNGILVLLGFLFLGVRSMGWTVYSSFALSFYVSLCEWLWPLASPMSSDTFLEFCFAVILPAVGSAIVFNVGASTGGTDIVAMILHKHTSLEIGRALMLSDLGIVVIAAGLYGARVGLYCILGLILKCTVVDGAIESLNLRKVCTVISQKPEQVEKFIIQELHRSATEQTAYGAYTKHEERVLMTVLTRSEATRLRIFLRKNDPQAFMTIVNSSEIVGKGFRSI